MPHERVARICFGQGRCGISTQIFWTESVSMFSSHIRSASRILPSFRVEMSASNVRNYGEVDDEEPERVNGAQGFLGFAAAQHLQNEEAVRCQGFNTIIICISILEARG